uniref:Tubulointerstitial nephritis antigen like 1 n=1 Tax=Anser brachyrhynchus TaxID=132585 RepID=A0A8B9CW85_9AVES
MTLEDGIRYRLGTFRPPPTVMNMNEMHVSPSPAPPRGPPQGSPRAHTGKLRHASPRWQRPRGVPVPARGSAPGVEAGKGPRAAPAVWRRQLSTFPPRNPRAAAVVFLPRCSSLRSHRKAGPAAAESAEPGAQALRCPRAAADSSPGGGGQKTGSPGGVLLAPLNSRGGGPWGAGWSIPRGCPASAAPWWDLGALPLPCQEPGAPPGPGSPPQERAKLAAHAQHRGLDSWRGLILAAFPALGRAGCHSLPRKAKPCMARVGALCPPRKGNAGRESAAGSGRAATARGHKEGPPPRPVAHAHATPAGTRGRMLSAGAARAEPKFRKGDGSSGGEHLYPAPPPSHTQPGAAGVPNPRGPTPLCLQWGWGFNAGQWGTALGMPWKGREFGGCGGVSPCLEHPPPPQMAMDSNEVLPRHFDAATKWPGMIHEPLDQGNCAGSWAFSTAAVASDRISIHSMGHMTPSLSPQNLLSCDTRNQRGCSGGRLDGAWWYLRRRGVVTDECYPFTSPESQPAAQPCMMHSRSTGRGKRQATARCPNPQTHANDIYQSTPAYRLASSVSTHGTWVWGVLGAAGAAGAVPGAGEGNGVTPAATPPPLGAALSLAGIWGISKGIWGHPAGCLCVPPGVLGRAEA